MKRSEMVKVLFKELLDIGDIYAVDEEELEETASYLLAVLERKGMTPPMINMWPQLDHASSEFRQIWEPENES